MRKQVEEVKPLVTTMDPSMPLRVVAEFVAYRASAVLDHNGNMNVTMRVPASSKSAAMPITDYPGVDMFVAVAVPAEVDPVGTA